MELTEYQKAIVEHTLKLHSGEIPSLLVSALAGTGKTFTTDYCIRAIPRGESIGSIGYFLFNKKNVTEYEAKLIQNPVSNVNLTTCTLNALGHRILIKHFGYKSGYDPETKKKTGNVDTGKYPRIIRKSFQDSPVDPDIQEQVIDDVEKLCKFVRFTYTDPHDPIAIQTMIDTYGLVVEDMALQRLPEILDAGQKFTEENGQWDFDDQAYVPLKMDLLTKTYDISFVDEGQDVNRAQDLFLEKVSHKPFLIGDYFQSIYGWRGAGINTFSDFIQKYNATLLSLPINWRSDQAIISRAQELVPDIQCAPDKPVGIVADKTMGELLNEIKIGDAIICRKNAPLFSVAIRLDLKGIPVKVKDKSAADALVAILDQIKKRKEKKGEYNFRFIKSYLEEYKEFEMSRLMKKLPKSRGQMIYLADKIEALYIFLGQFPSYSHWDFIKKIKDFCNAFSEDGNGNDYVYCSTSHSSKGLEWDRVWVIDYDNMELVWAEMLPWQLQQERNCHYVTITRARHELYLVR